MAFGRKKDEAEDPVDAAAAWVTSDEYKKKALKWFTRAAELTAAKNWDFAVACYADGLELWPDAVEEGHQPLRLAGCERNVRGGKKAGFSDTMKYSTSGKDAKKALANAARLLALDPYNITYMEAILKNANKIHAEVVLLWIGPIYLNASENEKKINPKRFALLRSIYEEAGDRAQICENPLAVRFFELAAEALQMQSHVDPKNRALDNELRDLSTKITILKGKYESAETFQESISNADDQKLLQDRERLVQDDDELAKLIVDAEKAVEETPGNVNKVNTLVELLCRRETDEGEKRAIDLLVAHYKKYGDLIYKQYAQDISIKQSRRKARRARDAGDSDRARELSSKLLKFEIKVYQERVKQYPTENRWKYELARRLFQAGLFDDAIPQFQGARADPKLRMQADLHLGRCFFEKKYYPQAIGTLKKAVEAYEIPEDTVGKNLQYWLARSLEDSGEGDEARDVYGKILELDYNFRDVRDRLERLQSSG